MANTFGTDILIQAEDPQKAADFYVKELGFEITDKKSNMVSLHGENINLFIERGPVLGPVTDKKSNMVSLHGENINLFIERGPVLGPVFEVTVKSVDEAKASLQKKGCQVIKDEPDFPRCYIKDPNGLIYNLTE